MGSADAFGERLALTTPTGGMFLWGRFTDGTSTTDPSVGDRPCRCSPLISVVGSCRVDRLETLDLSPVVPVRFITQEIRRLDVIELQRRSRSPTEGTDLLGAALARGVAFVPGAEFFTRPGGDDALRLCFATHVPDQLTEAVRRLAAAHAGLPAQSLFWNLEKAPG